MVRADTPLPIYAEQRGIFDDVMAAAMNKGDDPATVAKVIVAAATECRYRGSSANRAIRAATATEARLASSAQG